jgi:ribonucleoside-diphosphate reductase alpha chain
MIIVKRAGNEQSFDHLKMRQFITNMVNIIPKLYSIDVGKTVKSIQKGLSDKMSSDEILNYVTEHCASLGTHTHDYSVLAGRVCMTMLYNSTPAKFSDAMNKITHLLTPEFVEKVNAYDYDKHIIHNNDFNYDIIGIKTLLRSYLLKDKGSFIERPQYMLMRVAVFLCDTPEESIETYRIMSNGYYTHASPTLFHCGMKKHQLASCFLMTMKDDSIAGIYDTLKETALISKSAGGIGISVSNIRAKGSPIAGTNGTSNGLVPMLRVFNDTARYCDQGGGKRKGSFAIFIEPWHADIFEVLSLKLNHGLEEERARDLFYSLWISDKFMNAVQNDLEWHLFCPKDVPMLQNSYGEAFENHYNDAVAKGLSRKKIQARVLWNKIISTQMETGTPYLMYKDACNEKSLQKHLGVIKSSNLCAEIVEYSAPDETAVCTLASIALPKCVDVTGFNYKKLEKIAAMVTKNLNHVVDKTSYPVKAAENSNTRHRPIGIGVQGLADVFQMLSIPYDSEDAQRMNHDIFETIYYASVKQSVELAKQHGAFPSFTGSPASQGKFNFDLWGHYPSARYDWESLRKDMVQFGMRNSLLTACMPTASSASILGNTESFEPRTSNLYVRRVLSGEFMIMNKYLENACRKRNLWTSELRDQIIKHRGSVRDANLPDDIKKVFRTVWEMSQKALIDLSRGRAPYICQSQSLNLYQSSPTRNSLTSMHMYAWKQGLKTGQYYLRSQPKANAVAFTATPDKIQYKDGFELPGDGYTIYTKSNCDACLKVKKMLPDARFVNCDTYLEDADEFFDFLESLTDKAPSKFPMIFMNREYIGGYKELSMDIEEEECISCSA